MKSLARSLCPPLLWQAAHKLRAGFARSSMIQRADGPDNSVLTDPNVVRLLEWWGEGNAWSELRFIMAGRTGRVLDVACGVGVAINILRQFPGLDAYGCDLSETLIGKALESGIPRDRLAVVDATNMSCYLDSSFDWGYTLGAIHYFTDDGINKCLRECFRVVSGPTFHLVPVDRENRDRGWIRTFQSVQYNGLSWWERKFRAVYPYVQVLNSAWSDDLAIGKWLICSKNA